MDRCFANHKIKGNKISKWKETLRKHLKHKTRWQPNLSYDAIYIIQWVYLILLKEKHTFPQKKENCSRVVNFIFKKVIAQKESGIVFFCSSLCIKSVNDSVLLLFCWKAEQLIKWLLTVLSICDCNKNR